MKYQSLFSGKKERYYQFAVCGICTGSKKRLTDNPNVPSCFATKIKTGVQFIPSARLF